MALTSNSRLPNIQEVRPHHRAHKCITTGKKQVVHIMGPNVILLGILGYLAGGGLGGPSIIRLSPSCLPAILLPISIYI